jgi:hypothetical protein
MSCKHGRLEERIHALIDGYVENNGTASGQSAEDARTG